MHLLDPLNKSYCLYRICESNYFKLLKLVPDLLNIRGQATASIAGKPPLYIKIIERTPYTLTFELSHFFDYQTGALFEPAVRIRAYLDAKSVEVLRDRHRPHIEKAFRTPAAHREIMQYKWTLNYFLEKWLSHCLQLGYRFDRKQSMEAALL